MWAQMLGQTDSWLTREGGIRSGQEGSGDVSGGQTHNAGRR